MNKKVLLGFLMGMMIFAQASYGILVNGNCTLENQTNHEGTRVLFQADSPGAVTDSTFTDASGNYQIDVAMGAYDVFFSHEGFYDDEILDQLIFSPTTLPNVILIQMIGTPISGSLSGTLGPGTYLVLDDIYVDYYNILTIEPGTIFHFTGDDTTVLSFTIYGDLWAIGTEQDSITFMPAPGVPGWEGITFAGWDSLASDTMKYCFITGSNSSGIYCDYSSPIIDQCTICDNADYGIRFASYSYSSSSITNCVISDNGSSGIWCDDYSYPTIDNCMISGNYNGIDMDRSNPTIYNCTIDGNLGFGIYMWDDSTPMIDHCVLNENQEGGVYIEYSNPTISNCTISGNSNPWGWGGGIYCYSSSPDIYNTIIVESDTAWMGCIYFDYSPNASVTFCNTYCNGSSGLYGSPPQWLGMIVTVNANGDSCDLYYNIFEDPLFEDPQNGNFQITWANWPIWDETRSPCIDAGDPNSPYDPDNTVADMGAFYFHQGYTPPQPGIEVSATSLDFGEVAIGNQGDLILTIYSVGDTILACYDITCSDPAFTTDFSTTFLEPGDSLEVVVTFAPSEIRSYAETLTIDNDAETVVVTLLGEGVGPVDVALTPYNPPIVLPESGGIFDFNVAVENLTATQQTLDLWTVIHLPEVGEVPVMTVSGLALPGGVSINRDRSQTVPGFAPAGTYTYFAYVGNYPWVIEDYDSFTFTKEGSDAGGSLGSPSDWLCTGEGFETWINASIIEIPTEYSLFSAYPNPFNPTTTIRFGLPHEAMVSLRVYDISGREVVTLIEGWRTAGYHDAIFDGNGLTSGVYLFKLQANDYMACGKVVLMK